MCKYIGTKVWSYIKPQPVLICQIRSALVGLNLQLYQHVYITLPMWNPYYQKQAIGRAYRIGQKHPVHVEVLCLCDESKSFTTIDEYIVGIQNMKVEAIEKFIGKV